MQHPDEGMIHTWLDGELSPEESAALESHVAECEQCAATVAEARGLMAGASRIVSALDIVPGGVIPIAKPRQRVWYSRAQFRAAAAVLVVAGASLLVFRNENQNGATVVQRAEAVAEKKATPDFAPMAVPAGSAPAAKDQPKTAGAAANSSIPLANAPIAPAPKVRQASTAMSIADAAARRDALARPKDEDFSGKGVKGGTASEVADSRVAQSQRAGFAKAAEEPRTGDALQGKVAGVANTTRMTGVLDHLIVTGIAETEAEAKLIRVDSTKTPRQSFYKTAKGARLVLTELESPDFTGMGVKETASTTADRKSMARTRSVPAATRVMAPPAAPVPDPMIPFPTGAASQAAAKQAINTITWFDATGLRRFILTGPVSVAELESVKALLQKTKQ